MLTITPDERRARLGRRHHLSGEGDDVAGVVEDLVGLHSTDPATVYLSAWARVAGFTKDHLETALYESRSLIRVLGMRRTLFVVPTSLAPHLNRGCSAKYLESDQRKLIRVLQEQHGFGEVWLMDVKERTAAAAADLGPATARQLTASVPELSTKLQYGEGKKWGGEIGISTRVLALLAAEQRIVRGRPAGTWVSTQYRWTAGTDPPDDPPEPAESQGELARRWLATYGPGTFTDLKWWSGWGVGETKKALAACDAVEVRLEEGTGYTLPDDSEHAVVAPWAALLPALDPTAMGWKERGWYLGGYGADLFDRNGNIGPTVWLNGRVVGGWTQREDGEIRVELLEKLGRSETQMVEEKAGRLQQWLGEDRFVARFRTPLEKRLRG